jgi:hypothetical protein
MISKIKYNRVLKDTSVVDIPKIRTHIPTPTDIDYDRGYIIRYFVRKSNDEGSYIYEINSTEYSKLNSNPFFVVISLRWRISGEIVDVRESNRKSVKLASTEMKNIGRYLANLLQFHYRSPSRILNK